MLCPPATPRLSDLRGNVVRVHPLTSDSPIKESRLWYRLDMSATSTIMWLKDSWTSVLVGVPETDEQGCHSNDSRLL